MSCVYTFWRVYGLPNCTIIYKKYLLGVYINGNKIYIYKQSLFT